MIAGITMATILLELLAGSPDLPYTPPPVWSFEDGGTEELVTILGDGKLCVLAEGYEDRGYCLYASADKASVHVGRFNWALMERYPIDSLDCGEAYYEEDLPSMEITMRWAFSVFSRAGLETPTTMWKPGYPESSRDWASYFRFLREEGERI